MKQYISAAVTLILASACTISSKSTGATSDDSLLALLPIEETASDSTAKYKSTITLNLNFPEQGRQPLTDSLRHWLGEVFSISSPDSTANAAIFSQAVFDKTIADIKSGMEQMPDMGDFTLTYEYMWTADTIMTSPKTVSYYVNAYTYMGGAHGGTVYQAATFDAATGARLGWDMFLPDSLPKLREIVENGIIADSFSGNREDFKESLIIGDTDQVPLPAFPPVFTEKGIAFTYQQYEIVCYAAGMPGCVIPYDTQRPYMAPQAAALIPE